MSKGSWPARNTGKNYSKNYNDINWGNKKKKNPHKGKVIKDSKDWAEELNIHPDFNKVTYPEPFKCLESKTKLNCIASDKCQTNTETKE